MIKTQNGFEKKAMQKINDRRTIYPLFIFLLLIFWSVSLQAQVCAKKPNQCPCLMLTHEERAYLQKNPVLTLGYALGFEPFLIENSSNEYTGIVIDIYELIAERLGVTLRLEVGDWKATIQKLHDGDIDVIPLMDGRTALRNDALISEEVFEILTQVYAQKKTHIPFSSMKDLEHRRVAFNQNILVVDRFLAQYQKRIDLVRTQTTLDALTLLEDNQVDAVVSFNTGNFFLAKHFLTNIEPVFTIRELTVKSVSASRPDAPILRDILNKAIHDLSTNEKHAISDKWLSIDQKPVLTREETAYLQNNTFNIYVTNWEPFSILTNSTDSNLQVQGVSIDFWRALVQNMGVQYNFIKVDTFEEVLKRIQNDPNGLNLSTGKSPDREDYGVFSEVYDSYPVAIMTNLDAHFEKSLEDLNDKRIAVGKNFTTQKILETYYPNITLVPVKNTLEALERVARDEVYAAADILPVLNFIRHKYDHNHLKISGISKQNFDIRMMANKNSEKLIRILNRRMSFLAPEIMTGIKHKWEHVIVKEKINYTYVVVPVVLTLLILLWYYQRSQLLKVKNKELLQKNFELTETKAELEKARQLGNLGVWEFDLINDRLNWSDEIYKIFELDKKAFTPSHEAFLKIVHLEDRDKVCTTYENSLRTRKKYKTAHRIVSGSGRIKWVEAQCRAEFDDGGKPLLTLGTIYDITVQKEAEERLKEAMVAIKAANLAKSVFLSNMSHELRTPLNAILGYSQIFADDRTLNEKQQSGIKTIHNAAEHLLMIINEILDLSKIEAGKLDLYPHEIVLNKFLQGLCDIARNRCTQNKILFRYEADTHLPDIIVADEMRLRQILLNLLANAAKFTSSGYCLFRVTAEFLPEQKTKLTFMVEDSGAGIAKDQQKEVFEPFKQSGERLKYSEGTGLGLSISLQLASLMQGELSLISPVHNNDEAGYGPGSRFIFTAVFDRRDLTVSEKYFEPDAQYRLEKFKPGTKTILIVDDQPTNRAVLKDTLEPLGFLVTEAPDGKDVLTACEKQQPDLIFMDLVMPGVDGFTAIKGLQKTDLYARIPVVAITASLINQTNLRGKCQQVGFKGFLPKPFDKPDLLKIIADLLNLKLHQDNLTAVADENIVAPPAEILGQLQNHLADGNIDAIELMVSNIAEMDSGIYRAFAERLGQLTADIQLKGIEQLINQCHKKEG